MLWQANLNGSTQDLISLQQQLAKQVRTGLLPMLGAAGGFLETSTRPSNQEAYDLYLRSVARLMIPIPIERPSRSLESAVNWIRTTLRPGPKLASVITTTLLIPVAESRCSSTRTRRLERALALDQNLIAAASQLIVNRVDRGELGKAYESALGLVKRRPESAQAHFTLGYVQRYAGMLEESARQCDTALTLAPGNYQFRSCAWAFMELGKFERPSNFIQLDAAPSGLTTSLLPSCCGRADGGSARR